MAINDNIEEKIKKAKAAGYSDGQIETYLKGQGVTVPKKSLTQKVMGAAAKVTDTLGLRHASDVIADDVNNIVHPKLMEATNGPKRSLVDNAKAGAELGLATAGGELSGAAAAITKTAVKVASKSAAKTATKVATKVAEKASDIVTPVEEGVKTVLQSETPSRMTEKFTRYVTQAENAIKDYSIPTPLELAGQEGERALNALQVAKSTIGQRKSAVTEALGKHSIGNLPSVARRMLRSNIREVSGTVVKADQSVRNAAGRISSLSDPADMKLIREVDTVLSKLEANPSFRRADDAIDHIQDLLFKRKGATATPVNSKVESALKSVVKHLNDGLKTTAKNVGNSDYEALNAAYGEHKAVFDALNKGLGLEGNKGASLMKQLFSPNGTLPRKLFAQIKEKTGIDLVQEATLAKFAMENVGDVRQASLLEQILKGNAPTNSGGLIRHAAEKILNKVQDPIGKARRIIKAPRNK